MKIATEMVREASDPDKVDPWRNGFWVLTQEELERFAALVRADERNSWPAEMEAMERQVNILTDALANAKADERERIAQHFSDQNMGGVHTEWVAAAIRARGNT